MKLIALAACIVAVAMGACRREEPSAYTPMKLGVTADQDAVRR